MRVIKRIVLVLVAIVGLAIIVGLLLPSTAQIQRSITITAPPCTVWAVVNDLGQFNEWSPWFERDPATVYTFSGPRRGVGAAMTWASDSPEVGSGRQEITASEPYSNVTTFLDFGDQGTADVALTIEAGTDGTKVTWGFTTSFGFNLVGRYFGLMFDSWIGPDYEQGLAKLKALVEQLPAADWDGLEIEVEEMAPITLAVVSGSSSADHEAIGQALATAYGQVQQFLGRHNLASAGQPLAITSSWDEQGWQFDAGIPVTLAEGQAPPSDETVTLRQSYGGLAVRAVHIGPYAGLVETYKKVQAFVAANGYQEHDRPWEQYVSDPGDTAEEELVTHLYFPVQ